MSSTPLIMPGGFNPTWQDRVIALLKSSRPPGWTFGPILYGIGVIHSRNLPRTLGDLFRAVVQIGSLSVPLCISRFSLSGNVELAENPRLEPCSCIRYQRRVRL